MVAIILLAASFLPYFFSIYCLKILNEIEDEAYTVGKAGREISTAQLGEIVLKRLNSLDKVAYIRFASVYRKFNNLEEFIEEVKKISL